MDSKDSLAATELENSNLDFTDLYGAGLSTLNLNELAPDATSFLVDVLSPDALQKIEIGTSPPIEPEFRIAYARGPRMDFASCPSGTIIILEDDITTRKIVEAVLKKEGYSVRCSSNINEFLEALSMKPLPHLIITGLILPDTSGFDVLARLKQNAIFKAIPVMVLTGLADNKSLLQAIELGADGYLTKPTCPKTLLETVHLILGIKATREII